MTITELVKDLVLTVLSEALSGIQPKSRRMDVVKDIIRANNFQSISIAKGEEAKRLLRNYNGMNGRLRQDLIDLGFEITDEGKHYKITYFGDGRYQTTFARTPSDGRSGKNNALVVVRMAF